MMETTTPNPIAHPRNGMRYHPDRGNSATLILAITGSHLYGFSSPDSDFDLRAVHCCELSHLLGIGTVKSSFSDTYQNEDGAEIDFVSYELGKFCSLLLAGKGSALELIFSPFRLEGCIWADELEEIAKECISDNLGKHYLGFAHNIWAQFHNEPRNGVKKLLYCFRTILTGIHAMETRDVVCSLPELARIYKLPFLYEVIAAKINGNEHMTNVPIEAQEYYAPFMELSERLKELVRVSPNCPRHDSPAMLQTRRKLNDLVIHIRHEVG